MNNYLILTCISSVILLSACSTSPSPTDTAPVPETAPITTKTGSVTTTESTTTTTTTQEPMSQYNDSELKISFSYPSSRGTINKEKEGEALVILSTNNKVFIALGNNKPILGRGGFWGDEARFISKAEDITTVCQNITLDSSQGEQCSVQNNSQGISYATITQKHIEMGQDISQGVAVTSYQFYNPQSPRYGIVISTKNLTPSEQEQISSIVQTLSFE